MKGATVCAVSPLPNTHARDHGDYQLDPAPAGTAPGRNDIVGWCDLPGALVLWNIFRRGFADEEEHAPDVVLDHNRSVRRDRGSKLNAVEVVTTSQRTGV